MVNTHHGCQQEYEPDERLALPIEQAALLWCMRAWVIELKRGIGAEARVDNILCALGGQLASLCLKSFMLALSHACTRMIEVQCVCCKRISLDERALLEILSLTQASRSFEALLVLRCFVTQPGAEAALRCAEGIGLALARAGGFLPEPEEEVRHIVPSMTGGVVRPRNATLH